MRLVLDTNILVAAGFNPDSDAGRIVHGVRQGRFTLVWNNVTRDESRHVLRRIPPLDWQAFADLYRDEHRYDGPTDPSRFDPIEDEADRQFAGLADAAGALLVSNDEDLLSVRDRLPVTVMRPAEFAGHHL